MAKYQSNKTRSDFDASGARVFEDEEEMAQDELEMPATTEPADEVSEKSEKPASSIWTQDRTKPKGKEFELGDVLHIVTGKMLATEGYDSVFEVLSYLVGVHVDVLSYPEVLGKCRQHIVRQYPKMAPCQQGGELYEWDPEDTPLWMQHRIRDYGQTVHLEKLPDDERSELHEKINAAIRARNPRKRRLPKVGAMD